MMDENETFELLNVLWQMHENLVMHLKRLREKRIAPLSGIEYDCDVLKSWGNCRTFYTNYVKFKDLADKIYNEKSSNEELAQLKKILKDLKTKFEEVKL